jgi:hypothetical protein
MKELKEYVDQKNPWKGIFENKGLSLASAEDRQRIADMIDSDLSPENLKCAGWRTRDMVITRRKQLTKVANQLLALDPSIKIYEFYTGEEYGKAGTLLG